MPAAKKKASTFLESINPEAIIQLAMMCDAAEEEMVLPLGLKNLESDLEQHLVTKVDQVMRMAVSHVLNNTSLTVADQIISLFFWQDSIL